MCFLFCFFLQVGGGDSNLRLSSWGDQAVPLSHKALGRGICYFHLCFSLSGFGGGRWCFDFESDSLFMCRIEEIPELFIIGRPDMTIVAFGSNVVDIFEVNDVMSSKGWHLNALQRPNRCNFTFTLLTQEKIKLRHIFL